MLSYFFVFGSINTILCSIFGRTISMLLENIENYLLNCFDAVGILLMIRVSPCPAAVILILLLLLLLLSHDTADDLSAAPSDAAPQNPYSRSFL